MIQEIQINNALERETQPDGSYVTTIDAYDGCQLQCPYCFQLNNDDWAKRIFVRMNIADVLKKQLQNAECLKTELFIGSLSDPYMDIEKKYRLTRAVLETLKDAAVQVYITTKAVNGLILRDLELFKSFKFKPIIMIGLSDIKHAGDGSAHPNIEVVNQLYKEGIPVRVFITPILPYIMNIEDMAGAIRPEINIYLDKLRIFKKGNQHHRMYEFIKSEYPMYTENYHKILFDGNEDYYWNLVKKYKSNKRIIFMAELWKDEDFDVQ